MEKRQPRHASLTNKIDFSYDETEYNSKQRKLELQRFRRASMTDDERKAYQDRNRGYKNNRNWTEEERKLVKERKNERAIENRKDPERKSAENKRKNDWKKRKRENMTPEERDEVNRLRREKRNNRPEEEKAEANRLRREKRARIPEEEREIINAKERERKWRKKTSMTNRRFMPKYSEKKYKDKAVVSSLTGSGDEDVQASDEEGSTKGVVYTNTSAIHFSPMCSSEFDFELGPDSGSDSPLARELQNIWKVDTIKEKTDTDGFKWTVEELLFVESSGGTIDNSGIGRNDDIGLPSSTVGLFSEIDPFSNSW